MKRFLSLSWPQGFSLDRSFRQHFQNEETAAVAAAENRLKKVDRGKYGEAMKRTRLWRIDLDSVTGKRSGP